MKVEIKDAKVIKLNPEFILKYLIGNDEKADTLVMCNSSEVKLITTEQALYEALGCIKSYDDFKLNKLVKLLEVVEVQAGEKAILKEERVEELRGKALK